VKIQGTDYDIPVPDGWDAELRGLEIVLTGRAPDTAYHKDRVVTITLPATMSARSKCRYQSAYMTQGQTYVTGTGWVATGVWKARRTNARRRADTVIFDLATGRI